MAREIDLEAGHDRPHRPYIRPNRANRPYWAVRIRPNEDRHDAVDRQIDPEAVLQSREAVDRVNRAPDRPWDSAPWDAEAEAEGGNDAGRDEDPPLLA